MLNRKRLAEIATALCVVACTLAFVVIAPYETDSPWMATAVRRYLQEGAMRLSGLPSDAIFGRILLHANGLLYQLWPDYIATRWVQALAVMLMFPVFASMSRRLTPGSKPVPGVAPALYCLVMVSSGLLVDGRPEGVLVFFQVMTIWALGRYLDGAHGRFLVLAAVFIALGIETHPNGVLPALYIAVALFVSRAPMDGRSVAWLLMAMIVGLATVATGLLAGRGLTTFMTAFAEIAKDGGHGYLPHMEYTRYLSYLRRFPVHFLVLALGLIGLFHRAAQHTGVADAHWLRFIRGSALATLIFLALMPAKWEHYVAALYPFALLGLCLMIGQLQANLQRAVTLVAATAVTVSALIAFSDNDAAHRLLKLPTERGRILSELEGKLQNRTVLGPVKLFFFMPEDVRFHVTEGATFQPLSSIPGIDWVILDPLVDVRRAEVDLQRCLAYDMAIVLNRSHYNAYKVVPCPGIR